MYDSKTLGELKRPCCKSRNTSSSSAMSSWFMEILHGWQMASLQTVGTKYVLRNMRRKLKMGKYDIIIRLHMITYVPRNTNIARIANAVQCHNQLSVTKDCHEFRFSNVRTVISVSSVTSLQDCLFKIVSTVSVVKNYQKLSKTAKIVKIVKNCQK